jgi:hypothetical protein
VLGPNVNGKRLASTVSLTNDPAKLAPPNEQPEIMIVSDEEFEIENARLYHLPTDIGPKLTDAGTTSVPTAGGLVVVDDEQAPTNAASAKHARITNGRLKVPGKVLFIVVFLKDGFNLLNCILFVSHDNHLFEGGV